jgi:ABC-2 type transport system permease protein
MPSLALKTLRDLRRSFAGWCLGLVGLVAMIVSVYPTVRDNPALDKLVESYPDALQGFFGFGGELDYRSAAGYLGLELFSLMVPLLFLIAAVSAGTAALAGEEERGTLDLLLSLPLSRRRVALEKLAALVLESAALGLVLWLALWAGAAAAGMDIGAGRLAAATAAVVLLAVAFGAIALLAGALTGRRGLATGIAAAAAVAGYVAASLGPLVPAIAGVRRLSPFYYYSASDPLRHGLDPAHVAVLLAIALVAGAAAVVAAERREIRAA